MEFRVGPTRSGGAKRGRPGLLYVVGFLTVVVGFLTLPAQADPLADSLRQLNSLEAQQARLLARADSLRQVLAGLSAGQVTEQGQLLGEADRLGELSGELERSILPLKDLCRRLALQELDVLSDQASPERVARAVGLIGMLVDGRLSRAPGGEYVFVQPDSLDGLQTLFGKQALLQELQGRLLAWDDQLGKCEDAMGRERALRMAARQFGDEIAFLNEGGRIGSDEAVRTRGIPPVEGPDEGRGRVAGSGGGGVTNDELAGEIPHPEEEGGSLLSFIREGRTRIRRDLNRVEASLRATAMLIQRFESPPR